MKHFVFIFQIDKGGITPGCGIQESQGLQLAQMKIRTQQQQSMYNYTGFIPKITIRKLAFVQVTQHVVVAKYNRLQIKRVWDL